jgi:hypothetical protein
MLVAGGLCRFSLDRDGASWVAGKVHRLLSIRDGAVMTFAEQQPAASTAARAWLCGSFEALPSAGS